MNLKGNSIDSKLNFKGTCRHALSLALIPILSGSLAFAMQPADNPPSPPAAASMAMEPPPGGMGPGSMGRGGMRGGGFRIGPPGMWWKNADLAEKIGLTADQQKRMDDIFQQSRIQLIDLKANVEKQEVMLEPMLAANPPDTSKVLAQIDRVAQARADLEKGNAKMLLGIRGVLTPDQWTKLRTEGRDSRRAMMMRRFGNRQDGSRGPGDRRGPGSPRTPESPNSPHAPEPPPAQ
jgi:Spy/CpxP family protein refolding chaperone